MKIILHTILFLLLFQLVATGTQHTNCLKIKIFSKDKEIAFNARDKYVVHFQLENCGSKELPIDFYGNIGYPKDSTCNIYFEIYRANKNDSLFHPYQYHTIDYSNVVDSIMKLRPHKIYTFYLPLFDLYEIKDPGHYRIQGFYRFKTEGNTYFIQSSNYLYIDIK